MSFKERTEPQQIEIKIPCSGIEDESVQSLKDSFSKLELTGTIEYSKEELSLVIDYGPNVECFIYHTVESGPFKSEKIIEQENWVKFQLYNKEAESKLRDSLVPFGVSFDRFQTGTRINWHFDYSCEGAEIIFH